MKRCPACGAQSPSDAFCEIDGTRLVESQAPLSPVEAASPALASAPSKAGSLGGAPAPPTPPAVAPARCAFCGDGMIEADGFCGACGRRAMLAAGSIEGPPSTPPPSSSPRSPLAGAALAGGTVVSPQRDGHVVQRRTGEVVLVALGDAESLRSEARVLSLGGGPFPRVVDSGVDPIRGAYLALTRVARDARPLREVGPTLGIRLALRALTSLVEVARVVERAGLAWEPGRDDVHVRTDGALQLSRVRVPRKLAPGERLDARTLLQSIGSALVPAPAVDGPPRLFRLLLPHTPLAGDPGATIDDVLGELAAIERDVDPPADRAARVAGVCDPGLHRPHNEDAFATATGTTDGDDWAVLVICDGVSSSSHAEQASTIAARTACDALAHFARSGDIVHEAAAGAVATAIRAAHVAVCAQGIEATGGDPPGTTIVAALIWRKRLTVGWVGDSRAYWVSEQGSELVTRDHSWAMEAIARGEMSEQEAMRAPMAHALTRCLGPLEAVDSDEPASERIVEAQPDVRARDLPGPGWVVLCTDGFWNYFASANEVRVLVRAAAPVPSSTRLSSPDLPEEASPTRVARWLVNQAVARGGQDNTTVVVYRHSS